MVRFFYLHLMPWPSLPPDDAGARTPAWVTLSNRHFDPGTGHALYNEYLDDLEYAEALGFDGVAVNEHHQTAFGITPAPNLMAAALARRTRHARIALLGNAIALRDQPLRVAEEIAVLDVLTGGRIISGFVRGIGCEYFSLGVNPAHSHERFHEAHDLIVRAWTEPGPFAFEGRHYRVRHANIWPRPLQQPHPPVWIPTQGSIETIRWSAARRYPCVSVFTAAAQARRLAAEYRAAAAAAGSTAGPEQIGLAIPVHVAESDGRARAEAEPHIAWLFGRVLDIPPPLLAPPGYLTEASLRKFLAAGAPPLHELDFETLDREGYVLVGSPQTVAARLRDLRRDVGFGIFVVAGRIGTMPAGPARRSMELFAREVMPRLRAEGRTGAPAG